MSDQLPPALPQPPAGVPAPPPPLNLKTLWISLVLPPVVAVVTMVILALLPDKMQSTDAWLWIAGVILTLGLIAGWAMFIACICVRYRGSSRVLLILAYPLLQGAIVFSIFFLGCFVIIFDALGARGPLRSSTLIQSIQPTIGSISQSSSDRGGC